MSEEKIMWIVGKDANWFKWNHGNRDSVPPPHVNTCNWTLQGLFDSEEKARDVCCGHQGYFVAPTKVNVELPEEITLLPGAYYYGDGLERK